MPKSIPVIAIFDIGKTNKKIIVFNEEYEVVFEQSIQFEETIDEDGDPCDDLLRLRNWVQDFLYITTSSEEFDLKAVNFSAYGASFVHIDDNGNLLTPLYNYLKPYPETLKNKFYQIFEGKEEFSIQTSSPALESLNSGMQLYRLKYIRPELFKLIKYSLHLPQYLSWLITKKAYSDITSIGCHTGLWDFKKHDYHDWVRQEGIIGKLATVFPTDQVVPVKINGKKLAVGIGLHDSSSALIPYLFSSKESFVLISTGTWCISLNPFNDSLLTDQELKSNCLFYLSYAGNLVKSSRLFAGYEHEQHIKILAEHFHVDTEHYKKIKFDSGIIKHLTDQKLFTETNLQPSENSFPQTTFQYDLSHFKNYSEAYHQLILEIIQNQIKSTQLVLTKDKITKKIFVDGGFSNNRIYMTLLAAAFPSIEVYGASVAYASALGAALSIHSHWNSKPIPKNCVDLKRY